MGYFTTYSLQMHGSEEAVKAADKELHKFFEDADELLDGTYFSKWYYHADSMLELSRQHPEVLFVLEGIGEDHWDLWEERYKNGEYERQEARIPIERFSEAFKLDTER